MADTDQEIQLSMGQPEKHISFFWINVYIAIAVYNGVLSILRLIVFANRGQYYPAEIVVLIGVLSWCTAIGLWKRYKIGFATAFVMLSNMGSKGGDLIHKAQSVKFIVIGTLMIMLSVIVGINLWKTKDYFQ